MHVGRPPQALRTRVHHTHTTQTLLWFGVWRWLLLGSGLWPIHRCSALAMRFAVATFENRRVT